jgi:DNA-binding CsgD family transcriptional regulator
VGQKIFGIRELVPNSKSLPKTDYFKKVMAVEGWQSLLCLTYWRQSNPLAMVVVRKGGRSPDFTADEVELLESLYDHVDTALNRIQLMHDKEASVACLAQCLPNYPLGLLVLNEAMVPIFKNREALEAALQWNFGSKGARAYDPAKAFTVPAAVVEACQELSRRWTSRDACADEEHLLQPIFLNHSQDPKCRMSVSLIRPKGFCLAQPYYLVQFAGRIHTEQTSVDLPPEGLLRLQQLSTREQEVALSAIEGLSNTEIALKLGKAESTVKAQLYSVFEKLGIRRRSQLSAVLK